MAKKIEPTKNQSANYNQHVLLFLNHVIDKNTYCHWGRPLPSPLGTAPVLYRVCLNASVEKWPILEHSSYFHKTVA